jgi:hypothetical protein
MFALLCLSATHLATTNKDPSRYTQCALQLWTRSASLLRDKLSRPIDSTSVEQLIGASVLMQYIAWSHVEFVDEHQVSHGGDIPSCINMTHDPLFNLSSGVKDLYFEAFPALWGVIALSYQRRSTTPDSSLRRPSKTVAWIPGHM